MRLVHNLPLKKKSVVRPAGDADSGILLELIDALANYEKLTPPDDQGKARLIRDMSGANPRFHAFIAEYNGCPVGYSIYFETYSSFQALPKLYIEDIFVLPEYRSKKVGYAIFAALVEEAIRRGCGQMEWTVLHWNQLAIDFYKRLGAVKMQEWQLFCFKRRDMEQIINLKSSV
jgi:GNAT superfamily N-acetyltransferase